ncbi:MAG TPA: glycine cleavage T C-terminal barrel domain-containing protein, partial [Longimicrobiales bacterium]|nr:glycine cleavage T C-terminal barrel domain-containing protein [Longimicrobiales bacterium]
GRSPGAMLKGVITGVMPPAPREVREGVLGGRATYHALLTPKGKMITDLWATVLAADEAADYLLDVPVAGARGLREAFAKLLPPRFAAARDVSAETAALTLVGPGAAAALAPRALAGRVEAGELRALEEGEWRAALLPGQPPAEALLVIRTAEVWPEAWTVTGPAEPVVRLWEELVSEAGARPAGLGVWSILRVEAGRPVFGTDMDETTIPTEAGIDARAIDHRKGCYTGQEVIVRIRDRGHVNRHLRRLELGDVPAPAAGTELLAADGSGKVVGRVTSAVRSPRFGVAIALAYVARGATEVLLEGRSVEVPESA